MDTLQTSGWPEYELLDSGEGRRLERFGRYLMVRPEPHALWQPSRPDHPGWQQPDACFQEGKPASEAWQFAHTGLEKGWPVRWGTATFLVKPTPFRHVGLFPEQAAQWEWLNQKLKKASATGKPRVLNLFGYTGAASIVAAQAGADVCHVDAAKGSVYWASENVELSGLEGASIRWIVDDVRKFLKREVRRNNRYDLVMLDPPVFGRGPKGEIWRLERDLSLLAEHVKLILSERPLGLFLNFYATNLYPESVKRLFDQIFAETFPQFTLAEVVIRESGGEKLLQTGFSLYA